MRARSVAPFATVADFSLEGVREAELGRLGSSVHRTPTPQDFRTFGASRPSDMEAELEALPLGELDWQ